MHFYILLNKIGETGNAVQYKFYSYSQEDKIGIIQIDKTTGTVNLIEPISNDASGRLFERAAYALMKHWKKGEFPDITYWAS